MKSQPIPKYIMVKISRLEGKILENACRPWNCLFSCSDVNAFLEIDKIAQVIRALKLHQMEYAPMSKNRKRVKSLIVRIEQTRSAKNEQ